MKKTIFIVLLLSNLTFLYSQKNSKLAEIGALGGMGLNYHTAQFKELPQFPSCCPNYETGQGFGLNLGLFGNFIFIDQLSIGMKLSYNDLSGLLTREEFKEDGSDISSGGTSDLIIRHDLDATISAFTIEPTLNYNIVENLNGHLGIGASLLLSGTVSQKETLIEPKSEVFENGSATRNEKSGSLENMNSVLPLVSLGVSYDLPLSNKKNLFLSPTVSYTKRFGSVVNNVDWAVSTLNFGVQLRYVFEEVKSKPAPIKVDTIVPQELPNSAIAAEFDVKLNEEYSSDTIFVKYDKDLKFEAILGYVFFDENNSNIPSRYELLSENEANNFTTEKLKFENSLSGYHNILNILGQRFKKFPNVKVDLIGCNSDFGVEENNTQLSKQRAEEVRDYFVNVWGLNPERFTIKLRDLPETPSKTDNEYGRAENRRVEIVPHDWTIFKPQLMSDTTSSTDRNIEVTMVPRVDSKLPIAKWEVEIYNNDGVKKRFEGKGTPPSEINWNVLDDLVELPTETNPLNFKLTVTDTKNTTKSVVGSIATDESNSSEMSFVQKFVNDAKIEKYNLILFGYNITQLPPVAEVTLNLVKERITDKSQIVSIEGYSDMIGDEDYNMKLSYDRALTVAKALEVSSDKAIGRGKVKDEIYDNSLPEGRFYSRSVIVTLKEKSKED